MKPGSTEEEGETGRRTSDGLTNAGIFSTLGTTFKSPLEAFAKIAVAAGWAWAESLYQGEPVGEAGGNLKSHLQEVPGWGMGAEPVR